MSWINFSEQHPKDGTTILFLTTGKEEYLYSIWIGTFYEGDDEHVSTLITIENENEIFLDTDDGVRAIYWQYLPMSPNNGVYDWS